MRVRQTAWRVLWCMGLAFLLSTPEQWPGVEANEAYASIYWTDGVNLGTRRANLDGSNIETVISSDLNRL
jgi:Low-density lipoprotein receptor repeat class B